MTQTLHETASQMVARLAEGYVGPDAISRAMLREVQHCPDRMRTLLAEVLPAFVRPRLHDARARAARELNEPVATSPSKEPSPRTGRFVSRKVQAIHTAYEQLLATQYSTGEGYRRLGDCTAEDLAYAASLRRAQAAGNLFEAGRLEQLAAAVREYGAAKVAELPEAIVTEIMQRSAA